MTDSLNKIKSIPSFGDIAIDEWLWHRAMAASNGNGRRPMSLYMPSFKSYSTSEICNSPACDSFPAVSITGAKCALKCEHCRGKLLKSMIATPTPDLLWLKAKELFMRGTQGLLITGGSDINNRLPFDQFYNVVERIKTDLGLQVAVHTGLLDSSIANRLESCGVDTAMIDIIGSDETIQQIYHLEKPVDDFERSLEALTSTSMKVVPHIVAGLHFGEMKGEVKALDIVSRHPVNSLIIVVIVPYYAKIPVQFSPPDPEEVGAFLIDCRKSLPNTELVLGCARPGGVHKSKTDLYALAAGLDGIAFPSDGIVAAAKELGFEVDLGYSCCSMKTAGAVSNG